jgi:SAM-dependent methyltransferase
MAQAFPNASVVGFDIHEESIEVARRRAQEAGVPRACFEVADVLTRSTTGFDLVCFMDSFHDLGDPLGAAQRVYDALDDDGTLMLVEPFAADRLEDNSGPISRLYYCASTTMCTANALHQGDVALGAQAGPARVAEVLSGAGFRRVRVACDTPFNIVVEARK